VKSVSLSVAVPVRRRALRLQRGTTPLTVQMKL
jgi:hypothetical protein